VSLWGSDVLRRAAHPPVIQYIVFRRRNVSEIGHFFMDGVVEVKALDSMGVSSALSGMFFRTRLRKRNPRVVDLCSETVSPIDAGTNPSPIFTSRFAESCEAGSATTRAKVPRSLIAHGSIEDSDQGGTP